MDVPTDAAIIETATRRRAPTAALRCRAQRRRWQNFKAHRRGYWSLWIFLVLFVLSLFAEFIANDQPMIVKYKGELLLPGLRRLSGEEFGGIFVTEADLSRPRGQGDDRGERWLDAVAADPLLLRHAEQEPADGLSGAADLDADQGSNARLAIKGGIPTLRRRASNGTGSAPTTRDATSSPA